MYYRNDPSLEDQDVMYEGVKLGITQVFKGKRDWQDQDGMDGHCARTALYMILKDHPKEPNGQMAPQPWLLTVLKHICRVYTGNLRSEAFEKQVFHRYSRHFGLGQMTQMVENGKG